MFGFSLSKLTVLIAIVVVIWYGFKLLGRRRELENQRRGNFKGQNSKQLLELFLLIAIIGLIVVAIIWGVYVSLKPYL